MNDNIPRIELPEFASRSEHLMECVAFARECVSYRVGYEVKIASIIPVRRGRHTNMLIAWRRKTPELRVIWSKPFAAA